jgi:hypothetical protein
MCERMGPCQPSRGAKKTSTKKTGKAEKAAADKAAKELAAKTPASPLSARKSPKVWSCAS